MKKNISFRTILILFISLNTLLSVSGASIIHDHILSNKTIDQQVYSSTPDWESNNPQYSTGAALTDLNQDGWLDLVVADGNDMQKGRLNVYYNNEGSYPSTADWQSDDLKYNGHLDIADVNGDGCPRTRSRTSNR